MRTLCGKAYMSVHKNAVGESLSKLVSTAVENESVTKNAVPDEQCDQSVDKNAWAQSVIRTLSEARA